MGEKRDISCSGDNGPRTLFKYCIRVPSKRQKKGEKIKEKRYKHKEPPLLIENELNIYGLQYSERGIWWVSGRFSEAQKRWRTLLPCGCFFSLSHIGVQVTTSAAACDPI